METPREYRLQTADDLVQHSLVIGETDLAICLPGGVWEPVLEKGLRDLIIAKRRDLQSFIMEMPDFASAHQPLNLPNSAPMVAKSLATAASIANVGPMAAVAGYFAELAGRYILSSIEAKEIIVENGGDIFLASEQNRYVGIYAGEKSPFTGVMAVKIAAELTPCGICTSSGTIGSSFSYGQADAAMIIAADAALADATATATANMVKKPDDVAEACNIAMSIEGIQAALIICEEQMAAAGKIELVQI